MSEIFLLRLLCKRFWNKVKVHIAQKVLLLEFGAIILHVSHCFKEILSGSRIYDTLKPIFLFLISWARK